MAELDAVLTDLHVESAELDGLVAALDAAEWHRPTPAAGWTIAHQIGHLAWTDEVATLAATDPEAFRAELTHAAARMPGYVDEVAAARAVDAPATLLTGWRAGRERLQAALRQVPAGVRLAWFGPPMSAMSMATARLMETWAHGQDIADTVAVRREPTDRLRHVAHLGVRTREFAYLANGLAPPSEPVRVDLVGPHGDVWSWGPDDAPDRVSGPALDFCLLVTQRRNRADTELQAVGATASQWLDIAQAFAGPPGGGRPPLGELPR